MPNASTKALLAWLDEECSNRTWLIGQPALRKDLHKTDERIEEIVIELARRDTSWRVPSVDGMSKDPSLEQCLDDAGDSKPNTIMYIERKDGLTGPARIGRVRSSKSGKTLRYAGRSFKSLKGGYKANYFNIETGALYWISNCRKDGQDTLYPGIVQVDADARDEYWTEIRKRPDLVTQTEYRSEGKYSRRKPTPEKPNRPATGTR